MTISTVPGSASDRGRVWRDADNTVTVRVETHESVLVVYVAGEIDYLTAGDVRMNRTGLDEHMTLSPTLPRAIADVTGTTGGGAVREQGSSAAAEATR
ncbi:hypothetical protein [Actinomadura opuntiae]|uniref:hypothetical protein n=1 Tax=Actinomadura sp. OS1-43 TaxID=604315 RepID=UPI00255A8EBE|nr:hypothetical protein [Actinomadura sp. OS1-43]MDL4814441.1 hypothetical protein [Actinomadura sp. OS1-43]